MFKYSISVKHEKEANCIEFNIFDFEVAKKLFNEAVSRIINEPGNYTVKLIRLSDGKVLNSLIKDWR